MSNAKYSMRYLGTNLVAVARENSQHDFLAASSNLRGPNEIHYLRYSEDTDDLRCLRIYELQPEVLSIASCASDPSLICLVTNDVNKDGNGLFSIVPRGAIWKMEDLPSTEEEEEDDGQILEPPRVQLKKLVDVPNETFLKKVSTASDIAAGASDFGKLRHLSWGVEGTSTDSASDMSLLATYSAGVRLWTIRSDGSVVDDNSLVVSIQDNICVLNFARNTLLALLAPYFTPT